MMSRPTIIITHGLGRKKPDFHKKLERRLKKRLDCNVIPFFYSDILQVNQNKNYEPYEKLGNQLIRKFMFHNFSDAVTYYQPEVYEKVHRRLARVLARAVLEDGPVVLIAPSLGGQVVMDHIWDTQKRLDIDHSLIDLLITNGCNIPLFVSGLDRIAHIKQDLYWINFYDKADVLGYPLAPLGYQAQDIRVRTHAWLFSHLRYWSNKRFLSTVVRAIERL